MKLYKLFLESSDDKIIALQRKIRTNPGDLLARYQLIRYLQRAGLGLSYNDLVNDIASNNGAILKCVEYSKRMLLNDSFWRLYLNYDYINNIINDMVKFKGSLTLIDRSGMIHKIIDIKAPTDEKRAIIGKLINLGRLLNIVYEPISHHFKVTYIEGFANIYDLDLEELAQIAFL